MPAKEIKALRQSGNLKEAFDMALKEYQADPENIWGKRNLSWVYYEYLKENRQVETYESFKKSLNKVKELQLPEDENMLFDSCAWQIGSLVFNLQKEQNVNYVRINELLEVIKDFHFTKPSVGYSFLYKAFHKGYKDWNSYLNFADWWGFENFRQEDYLKEEYNGRKIMSLVQQAYIAYSKKLLEGEPMDAYGQQRKIDKEKIQSFLPKLDNLITDHPEYQYPPYFKAKLLLASGNDEDVLSAFLPFAKQKRNDFWVWELMAEIFHENKDLQFACYCKALSLKTPEDFLVKLRQSFAEILVERELYTEAKTEIQKVIATREKHSWKLPNQIVGWTNKEWFTSSKSNGANKDLYLKHKEKAEEILYQDIPEELVAVEFVNKNKNILNYIKNKNEHGFFKYPKFIETPEVGDVLKVRFATHENSGFSKIYTLKKVESNQDVESIKYFEGILRKNPKNNFGFVDNIFFDSHLLQKHNLNDGDNLNGKAILSYNKKKEEFDWKCFDIN